MRFTFIDLLKAVAAQFIVFHHLVAYGPVADAIQTIAPALVSWLYNDARMAVQAFLVIGGYLAARALSHAKADAPSFPWVGIANRYLRLSIPFIAALVVAIAAATLVRPWFDNEAVPDAPTLWQMLSHVFLLHGVLGHTSLTAGAWYVAIDFQLFALLSIVFWVAQRQRHNTLKRAILPVLVLCLLSLFVFNRNAGLDNYAFYFFRAYGLGVLAYWMTTWSKPARGLYVLAAIGALACAIEFRERILLATLVAMALLAMRNVSGNENSRGVQLASYFGRTSYSLFLIHFPLCLLANALFDMLELESGLMGMLFAVVTWLAANLAADLFYRRIEAPSMQLRSTAVWALLLQGLGKLRGLRALFAGK